MNVSRNIRYYVTTGISLLAVFIALVIPNNLFWISSNSFGVLPIELLVLGLFLLLPGRFGVMLRWSVAALLAVGVIFKIADIATYKVFARPFNPIFDAYLLSNGMHLLNGAVGTVMALLVAAFLVVLVIAIIALAFALLGRIRGFLLIKPKVSVVSLLLLSACWGAMWMNYSPYASKKFYDHLAMHIQHTYNSIQDIKEFEQLLAKKDGEPLQGLFESLQGKDVLIIFIESYGRTALDKAEFSEHLRPLMQRQSEKLSDAGIGVRSAYLTSPTVGGLSWLAHGTAMSGLWINSQLRYDSLVMSKHPSLNKLFNEAGWRSVGVMPAISMAWPEGNYYGYDQLYHAHNSGYAGKPFNWVTMPDQFTLSAFQQNELQDEKRSPVMAEIALISSHAPWTPVPQLVDWSEIGNGEIFNVQAMSGDTPEQVWKDPARIRLQFRLSIEYTLKTLVDYVLTYGNENLVVMAFGDHQPAPLVTGDSDNRDVPVHFFARDSKILEAISGWQWVEGMIPSDDGPVWRMDEVREQFINTFSALP